MRSGKLCPRGGAGPGDPGRPGKGAAGPRAAGGSGSGRRGRAGAEAAPTCAGRPQAQVAEVAQAAGLRLRGGFSITTSPAQERAGRGAAPGAGARGGRARAGRGAILAGAGASSSGAPGRGVREGPTQRDPPASVSPRPEPCARFPGPTAQPPARPTLPGRRHPPPRPARSRSCAPAGPSPHPSGATHPPGGGQPAPLLRQLSPPGVPVRSRGGRGAAGNNSSCPSTARTVPGPVLNPLRVFILAPAP